MNDFRLNNLELVDLEKSFLNNSKHISHEIKKNYVEYKKEYYDKSIFKNLTFKIEKGDNIIICPLTLEKRGDKNFLNFFGEPIRIFSKKIIDSGINSYLIDYFKNLKKKHDLQNLFFKIKDNNENNSLTNKNSCKMGGDIFINLGLELDEIKKCFDPKLRNELKKNNKEVDFILINANNYEKDEILKMRDLHVSVAGRETRTKKSWIANEKMILDGNGFLIKVIFKKKIISYSLFYFNEETCIYFSSCTLRDYFKIVKNIGDKAIWNAIQFVKNKSNNFYIGSIYEYLKQNTAKNEKELNIDKFKLKFNKKYEKFCLYSEIPKKFSSYLSV